MKFWEAMKAVEEGKKVACKSWVDDPHCRYTSKTTGRWVAIEDFSNEWELFGEPEQLLSFAEVVKGMKEGKKFRRKEWSDKNAYIEPNSCQYFPDQKRINNQDGDLCPLWLKDFEATDWVEVK